MEAPMLSRTANSVYWLARYMERVDNLARLLEVGRRMSAQSHSGGQNEWASTIIAAGCQDSFYQAHQEANAKNVIDFLARDPENPSSIRSCITSARNNARSVRSAITQDMWDALNGIWLEGKAKSDRDFHGDRLPDTLDWVKRGSLLFNGAYSNSMMRNDVFYFTRLGTWTERADNTARILDVKYHILLPDHASVGGGIDYDQWCAILRAVSALRSYHWIYSDRIQPWNVAEMLILRPEMPRSLRASYDRIVENLDLLADYYGGQTGECHRIAGIAHAKLRYGKIDEIFRTGLHEFLTEYIDNTTQLGDEIAIFYLM